MIDSRNIFEQENNMLKTIFYKSRMVAWEVYELSKLQNWVQISKSSLVDSETLGESTDFLESAFPPLYPN